MIIAVVQASRQRNRHSGAVIDTARGAILPGGWETVAEGWSWLHHNGHIGIVGRGLAETKEEAEGVMNRINTAARGASK